MATKPLTGYTIVITGTLSIPRAEFARLLEDAGAVVKPTITRDTTMLVMGDDVGDGKVDKARELGVSMFSEEMARAAMAGKCGIANVTILSRNTPYVQKVFGSSDDLVELIGEVSDELEGGDEDTFVRFSNGTYVAIHYGDEGIWRARVIEAGRGKVRKLYGIPDDGDEGTDHQAHRDPDAPVYSDVLIIESEEPIALESWGRKPLPAPRAGLAKANEIVKGIYKHASDWWDDMDLDTRNDVIDEIARIVEGKP